MEEKTGKIKRRHLVDIIVLSSIVFIALISVLFSLLSRKSGSYAVVEVNGEVVGVYSLSENATYVLNSGTNTLVIENGEAYLINSHCPDHSCEKTGKVKYVGQSIICLPNRVSVIIKGDSKNGVDLVS